MAQEADRTTMLEDVLELKQLQELDWPTRTTELRTAGVPLMLDPADPDPDDPDPDPAPDPDLAPGPAQDDPPTFDVEYVKKLRDEAARHRREARDAQARVKEYEDKDKSDVQRLEERATEAETRASTAERELIRTRVALKKGLTDSQAKRLIGDTEEELEADADELLASFKIDDDDGQDPGSLRRPRERLRPGAISRVGDDPDETDPSKLAALVPRT